MNELGYDTNSGRAGYQLSFGNPYRFAKVSTEVKRIDYQLPGQDYKSSPHPYSVKKLSFGKPARIAKARRKKIQANCLTCTR